MKTDAKIAGPVAIVTGGTHDIGRATVSLLSESGWQVVFQGRSESEGRELEATRLGLIYVAGDLVEESTIRRLVARAEELGDGRIAGLVNNAAVGVRRRFEDCHASDWGRLFSINARSAFLVTRHALKGLRAGPGLVVSISSVTGNGGEDGLSVYCASKASMIGLAKALAIELGEEARFNVLCLGQIATRMMARRSRRPISSRRRPAASRCSVLQRRAKSPRPFRFFFCLDRPSSTVTPSPSTAGIVGIAPAKPRKVRGKSKGDSIGIGAQQVDTGG
jgi:NAD(P)-dependent dehydrogenase (short-subunit alcohol dehydrogenase family)